MMLRDRIAGVLATDAPEVARLSAAGTTVTFIVPDEQPITVLLDRDPPTLSDDHAAEIEIRLGADSAESFAAGELVLGNALIAGDATCSGPVRKYLAVDPILRGMLGGPR